ncbi:RING-finger, DEAD-like helicase, PHD and SNF2 domain-containing protein [Tasmannia lanceolata]|uniref:RING-finger, DEAD-like helicase, PHD and SNF2 domain-containing protein n=1 Tax=Tasmannia lanceolata TaxID=3420 RepID=UPI004063BD5E
MGRRKKTRPIRSGGIIGKLKAAECGNTEGKLENSESSKPIDENNKDKIKDSSKLFLVDIDQSYWDSDEHFDIAEVVLTDISIADRCSGYKLMDDFFRKEVFSLQFRLHAVEESSFRLGHWPVISADNIFMEFLVSETCQLENEKTPTVIFSGIFDGPDEGVSGLFHLVSQKLLMLRPVSEIRVLENGLSCCVRVEILKTAFGACESLVDNTRQPWKKSMMNVMAWLRPEVSTPEAKYGISKLKIEESDRCPEKDATFGSRKHTRFDVAGFYEAIKPSKDEPMLEDKYPDLLPQLRPYQRRAAYWMVQRERGTPEALGRTDQFYSPLCVTLDFLDMHSQMFYNPFSGNISMHPEHTSSYVSGGILADEMGLGKTVELLACIFAHRSLSSEGAIHSDDETSDIGNHKSNMKRLKRERVECICGAVSESATYKGLWVQCDVCDAWQHADCVGYLPGRKPSHSDGASKLRGCSKNASVKLQTRSKNKFATDMVVMDGNYICSLCSELIHVTDSLIATGATLIVCPATILPQWHSEIVRHTKPGSLKTCVYEGVKNFMPSTTSRMDISKLASADIVLTSYEVLKDDLSHDSDRHDGDRRFMRFQKRYPVVPTPLTRIFWWRICLDEAQMVESNTAAATEMALRLRCQHHWCITGTPIQRRLDDLYGLLRFLGASPFDVHRWWVEVIRVPYERKEVGAMDFAHNFFKQIMWRSSKAHVSDELQLPPQEEWISWLTFSQIEAHFYQRQHETCMTSALGVVERIKDGSNASCDTSLSHNEAAKLLHPLLKLRQACCHPQVGSSGLRSLHHSPMTMEEILEVLVSKAKTEGEEALRRTIGALNGLAGIAVIEQDLPRAVSLYREAMSLAEKYSVDFRLDPLLNIHIHHNLAELLSITSKCSQQFATMGGEFSENSTENNTKMYGQSDPDQHVVKRQKISNGSSSGLTSDDMPLEHCERSPCSTAELSSFGVKGDNGAITFSEGCLRKACEHIKQKYLSVFVSKHSLAQQEFEHSYMQVCDALTKCKGQHVPWWLQSLDQIEQNNDSSNDLIRKIDEAVSQAVHNSKSSRVSSRFQTISGLKYLIQTGLDSLETSRQELLARLLEIDQTMEKPRDEDIERVRHCPNCQAGSDGPICVHCELHELFQVYEARLFRLTKGHNGGMISSAEEAVDLQKKIFARKRFFGALDHAKKNSNASDFENEENKRQRDAKSIVVVSRSPSELEVILGIIKNYSKALLEREAMSYARKHLLLIEAMRKEYAQARFLSLAQSQILCAHDDIKMATSRLRLRETENDTSAIDVISSEEIITASLQNTNEKFLALSALSRIKGQLRYLRGLVLSKQETQLDDPNTSSMPQGTTSLEASSLHTTVECSSKSDDEFCPVCHEKLSIQKVVFQCGHFTCCKCLIAMTEQELVHHCKGEWVMCPTCRQRTEYGNIAYVDDRQPKVCDYVMPNTFKGHDISEISIPVQGSYGTKIEAVTRRIMWIKSTDQEAKVIVFSSWNDVLDVLEHALDANNITYIRMKGGRKSQIAIAQFKGQKSSVEVTGKSPKPKSVQVLLLLIQHGANGLNLLEAEHVVLVEPLLNPATEAQAINRVHRIGQGKITFVHRFMVKDTVEESIYKLNRSKTMNPIIGGNTKNQEESVLTLKDVECLFSPKKPADPPENADQTTESLRHLPPAVAAALAAERRLKQSS